MQYLLSFLFCGMLCVIAQYIFDSTKLTAGHITSLFVIIGGVLEIFNIYDIIVDKVGSGAALPITSFGHSLTHAMIEGNNQGGFLSGLSNMFSSTGAGIALAVCFSFLVALIFRART